VTEYLIHCGMPKTGTSVLQAALAGSASMLLAAGVHYPAVGRSGNAHHALAIRLREEGPSAPATLAAEVRDEVAGLPGPAPRIVICSSEQFSNLFGTHDRPRLLGFLGGLGHRVRAVVVLREYTGYIESIYLQGARFSTGRSDFGTFLAHAEAALPNLLSNITQLVADPGARLEVVLAGPGFEVLSLFDRQLRLPPGCLQPAQLDRAATAKPTLKVQAVLSNLLWVEERVGFRIRRNRLLRQVRAGKLRFDDDLSRYTIYPPGRRSTSAAALLPVMHALGFHDFAALSEPHALAESDGTAGAPPYHPIETTTIADADLARLRELRRQIEDISPDPAG
jgi:hypothetical protein